MALTTFGLRAGMDLKAGADNFFAYANRQGGSQSDPVTIAEVEAVGEDVLIEAAKEMHLAWRRYLRSVTEPGESIPDVPLGFSDDIEERALKDLNEYGGIVYAWTGRTVDAPQGEDVPQQIGTFMDKWEKGLAALEDGTLLADYAVDEGVIDPTADEPGGFEMVEVERTTACTDDEYASDD